MAITNPDYSSLDHDAMASAIGLQAKHIPILIASFLEESGEILQALQGAVAQKDYDLIRSKAHSIKGSAGNLKFNEVYEMARSMELAAAEADASFDYAGYLAAIKGGIATIN